MDLSHSHITAIFILIYKYKLKSKYCRGPQYVVVPENTKIGNNITTFSILNNLQIYRGISCSVHQVPSTTQFIFAILLCNVFVTDSKPTA